MAMGDGAGRPRGSRKSLLTAQIRDLLIEHVPKAIQVLVEELDSKENRAGVAQDILNRVYGKAPQAVQVTGENGGPLVAVIKDG